VKNISVCVLVLCALAACSVDMRGTSFVRDGTKEITKTARIGTQAPQLLPDGTCEANISLDPSTLSRPTVIANGITECDLVRIKGQTPTDVLIGESGKGQRETQVLYSEPGGRELYFFTDNALTRQVKPQ
jgi:hypothetical protein